tara:strand:+ start:53762 stop:54157 length:396 start_codon:yes stop_codon:yes gene_type:complete
MRNVLLITCFLLSISVFAQEGESITKDLKLPKSIFVVNSLSFQSQFPTVFDDLRLTGHRFMIVDGFYNYGTNLHIDTRNIGRVVSDDDLMDTYMKAKLTRFDVSKNSSHFIWNMWDVHVQKQQYAMVKTNN